RCTGAVGLHRRLGTLHRRACPTTSLHGSLVVAWRWRAIARDALVIEANIVSLLGIGEAPGGASASPPSLSRVSRNSEAASPNLRCSTADLVLSVSRVPRRPRLHLVLFPRLLNGLCSFFS